MKLYLMFIGLILIVTAGVITSVGFSSSPPEKGFICKNTTYQTNNWSLSYLKNATIYCSNGGD